jgi:Na+/proline symporter
VAGLVIAAILAAAMSNLSAALNSLSSTTIMDFYRPIAGRHNSARTDAFFLRVARWATVAWGAVMAAIDEINEKGTFSALATGARLNPLFSGAARA